MSRNLFPKSTWRLPHHKSRSRATRDPAQQQHSCDRGTLASSHEGSRRHPAFPTHRGTADRKSLNALVGSGDNLVDSTLSTMRHAHLNAAKRMTPGSPVAGRAYFISQGDPRPMRDPINAILDTAGLPAVTRSIPLPLAYVAAWFLEAGYRMFHVANEPPVTRLTVLEMGRDHYFDISAARQDLGYHPPSAWKKASSECDRPSEMIADGNKARDFRNTQDEVFAICDY